MPPKGWTTIKLRATTRKRLDRLQAVMTKPDDEHGEHKTDDEQVITNMANLSNLSYDGIVNLLIDEYYYRRLL